MSKKATTKDELFLCKLYELSSQRGGPQEPVDRYEVGRAIGQNDKGANIIARDLAQANFIKKGEGEEVFLTDHGLRLVRALLR
jgi:Mn-dependent DtxR family transcriptional regulator